MTLAPTDEQKNEQRIAELEAQVKTLEAKIAEQEEALASKESEAPKKKLAIKDYKQGQYVRILAPGHADWIEGRVIDHGVGKSTVHVGTARGEFPIGHPDRIEAAK
jgi:hypothetical protein